MSPSKIPDTKLVPSTVQISRMYCTPKYNWTQLIFSCWLIVTLWSVCVFTECIIDTSFLRFGYCTYVVLRWIFPWHLVRCFLGASVVLPFTYNKSCDVFESIGHGTPALYWLYDIVIRNVLLISSFGVIQFFIICCFHVAPIVFLKEYTPTPPSPFGPPLISSAVFLLYTHFAIIFGIDTDYIFSLACQSRRSVLADILPSIGTLLGITSMLQFVSLLL